MLAAGFDVTLLTNFNQDTYLEAEALYPFLTRARGETVSGRVKILKPDAAIYAHHTEIFGLDPAATVFIDDSPKNVDGAKAFGWDAILFTDADALRQALAARGVLLA